MKNPTVASLGKFLATLLLGLCLVAQNARADDRRDDDSDDDPKNPKVQVALTAPVPGTLYTAPATVMLAASAQSRQKNHPIARVEFYQGATLIGTATTAPYAVTWSNVAAGVYSLTARAFNDKGDSAVGAAVGIVVNAPPTVALTSPGPNQVVNAPGMLTLSANAADSDDTVARVEFYQGNTLIGMVTAAPYSVAWSNVPAGTYSLTARATDDRGATTTSAPVPVVVNAPPTIALMSPAANQVVNAPATLTVSANAADSDGAVAKVEFYQGTTPIGTATAAPYSVVWSNVQPGSYTLTAKATDDRGATTASAPVQVIVNAPPTVALTSPTPNQLFNAPGTLTVTAAAADADSVIAKVDFYQGTTLIGTATAAPYSITWSNVPSGTYSLTAVATDDRGAASTSAPVQVVVNALPTVAITSPASNMRIIAPATISVSASAADSDGTVAKVEFYQGTALIGTATVAPYSVTWSNVQPGSYSVTAVATDDRGATATSAPVALTVAANQAPTVSLIAPVAGQKFTAPASIALAVNAADIDGSIASVSYFQNGNPIGTATTAPFGYTWTNVPQGTYSLTAQGTDDSGVQTVSAAVSITVNAAGPALGMYFIHPDHLGSPRAITDSQQQVVWRWDNTEPFGNNPPNEDPNATGTPFSFNLRYPGQYFDRETNLHYNYFRDYDPATGRYVQSDPIGLKGGINTYTYADNAPTMFTDPLGLKTFMCKKPLHALGGEGARSGPDVSGNPLYHQYVCISDGKGGFICGGQDQRGQKWYDPINGPGKPSNDKYDPQTCEQKEPDNNCIEQCLARKFAGSRPRYGIPFGTDCQEWSDDALKDCQKQCKKK